MNEPHLSLALFGLIKVDKDADFCVNCSSIDYKPVILKTFALIISYNSCWVNISSTESKTTFQNNLCTQGYFMKALFYWTRDIQEIHVQAFHFLISCTAYTTMHCIVYYTIIHCI